MKENIIKNLETLRKLMADRGIDAYIIPTNDFHGSEYVCDYFKTRAFMSSFTGSNGTLVITLTEAGLWTDGRYFLQAEDQLSGTTIDLYKEKEPDVLTIPGFLKAKLPEKCKIGFDGRVVSVKFVEEILAELNSETVEISFNEDLVDLIWTDRPSISKQPAYELEVIYSGLERTAKIAQVKEHLQEINAHRLVLTSLDDIAWLFNIRGNDVACNPVLLSYAVVSLDEVILYVNEGVIDQKLLAKFKAENIIVKDYFAIYDDVVNYKKEEVIVYEKAKVNYALCSLIKVDKVIDEVNYTTMLKAVKNASEIKNAYLAHLKDGIAVTRFIYWLKNNVGKIEMDEISVSDKLEEFRKMQPNFQGISFETISGYKEHGAIIHYFATPDTNKKISHESFLLVDSGGQYLEGTTDVTRTISLGELSDKEKLCYTLVLKGHLALANAIFKSGTAGIQLDILARLPLFQYGYNYNHGTGHGVGSFLNVHEGPQNISATPRAIHEFKEGMITSNEPGLYLANEFGVRIENLVLCINKQTTEFGTFLGFDNLTLVPYDIESIDQSLLTLEEKELIHKYHERVYESLKNYLTDEERCWLKDIKEAI